MSPLKSLVFNAVEQKVNQRVMFIARHNNMIAPNATVPIMGLPDLSILGLRRSNQEPLAQEPLNVVFRRIQNELHFQIGSIDKDTMNTWRYIL